MRRLPPNTFLDRPPLLYVWRPIYRFVMTPVVLPAARAFRSIFFHDMESRLRLAQHDIATLKTSTADLRSELTDIVNQRYIDLLANLDAFERSLTESMKVLHEASRKHDRSVEALQRKLEALMQVEGDLDSVTLRGEIRALGAQLGESRSEQARLVGELTELVVALIGALPSAAAGSGPTDR